MATPDLAALGEEVRRLRQAGTPKTFVVHVREHAGWFTLTIPEVADLTLEINKRRDIEPEARQRIASALEVPPYFFDLFFRFQN
jgi:hypothetical protein